MNSEIERLSQLARIAIEKQDWQKVAASAHAILTLDAKSAEGHFFAGVVERVSQRTAYAVRHFNAVLEADTSRYDAAIELANQYSIQRLNGKALSVINEYKDRLSTSSYYLNLAGAVLNDIGLPKEAYPMFKRAVELQPTVDLFQANLASCAVYLGKIDEAKAIYNALLTRFPDHQRNHYQLSRLEKAKDDKHINAMLRVLERTQLPPEKNIFIYYAIAKEFEDLCRWSEAFKYYKLGGDAVCQVSSHNCDEDIALIDKVIECCSKEWVNGQSNTVTSSQQPIFIVGLPRTGTTLCERIISSHSDVDSLGETLFFQMVLRRESGISSHQAITPEMIEALIDSDPSKIAKGYIDQVDYRLKESAYFIDKLPFNILYLGFYAKAFPNAKIVYLHRNPMDACFAMYKQVFTWAYKYSYSLEAIGKYYVAFNRLVKHWKSVLGDRIVQVNYEDLVENTESVTRKMLTTLDLPFEQACLDFDKNEAPSATASSVQVREKAHQNSVEKWKHFENELLPLKQYLENAGIEL
ncbi:tetratricopeptide repeat-containing sulfotransferase family protein [Alteromonas gracilis]|jgi:Tfp pilus assembly protein PilF|uniref:tetratricopeptide repeat-containing sulfotransferase family protein n=1 Tax=Alteromonas gracilis TaxID=1479524 RepID=UPI002FE17F74